MCRNIVCVIHELYEAGLEPQFWGGQAVPAVVKLAKALGISTDVFAECDEIVREDANEPDEKPATKKGKK
jgi:hypothetical protein